MKKSDLQSNLTKSIQESTKTVQNTINLIPELEQAIITMVRCISKGHKIVLFGNGGSAADAQHIAAELIGRFKLKRKSLPAIALTTDTSCITALSNDYSFDIIFSRQCESLVNVDDVVIAISTSGNSKNIVKGLEMSKEKGAKTISLLGNSGGTIKNYSDIAIIVDSDVTAHIQEAHRVIYHTICNFVEKSLSE